MKKKLYDYVELLSFEREKKKPREQAYYDTATVRYTSPISGDTGIFKIIAEHIEKLNHITLDGQEEGNPSVFDLYTGAETAIPSTYKRYLYRAKTDSSYELIAALVGFYYYKLPKKVRDVKALKLDKETEDAWGDILDNL